MTQKDIDRLLAARKLVDDYRNLDKEHDLKAQCYADLTAAKTDSKISVTDTKAEIQRIDDKRDAATKTMNDGLKELGFDTYSDFVKFNSLATKEVYKDCRPIKGECDLCGEKVLDKQPCVTNYGELNCVNKALGKDSDKLEYQESFLRYMRGDTYFSEDREFSVSVCPKGHGFENDEANAKDFPFDIKWRA